MKRILTVLMAALVMAAMLMVEAAPAFADSGKVGQGDKKVGVKSSRPNDGAGAYDIGTKDFHGPNR